jgi:NADH oxidase (H2O2-forming)
VNQDKNIVIIGCGAGGGTSAQFARKTDRNSNIVVFEKGKYPQYSKCGLPYVLSGNIPEFNDLIEFSEEWFKKANINLMMETKVEQIDVKNKVVIAKKGNHIVEKPYSSLIISTGSKPILPTIKNIKIGEKLVEGVYTLRTIDDAKKISQFIEKNKRATIVGAGLIGLEMADCLNKKGMEITVIESMPTVLPYTLDEDISDIIQKEISEKITLFTDYLAIEIESKDKKIKKVCIKNNKTSEEKIVDTDLLIIATGTKPEVSLAEKVGCKIGKTGGIVVNDKSETSVKDIFAVGDCTEYLDFITKKPIPIGLGSIVVRQGITAGINAAGGNYRLTKGFLQTCTSEFFKIELASVGPTTKKLEDSSFISGRFKGMSLPEYYPGGKPITIKVIIDKKTGCIIAAQAIGSNAAQRINTLACAILNKMDVNTFRNLETAYAPPISPTLDVMTLACDAASIKLKHIKR